MKNVDSGKLLVPAWLTPEGMLQDVRTGLVIRRATKSERDADNGRPWTGRHGAEFQVTMSADRIAPLFKAEL